MALSPLRRFSPALLVVLTLPLVASKAFSAAEEKEEQEHKVTLNESDEVTQLLKKARKAREEAEKDPAKWPECVKAYAEILKKYPNTVYLANRSERAMDKWGLGVYRSTSEKVAEELAGLPPAALEVYRSENDVYAKNVMEEAQEALDSRGMEKVAQIYFSTKWGDDALLWLSEWAYNHGSLRQSLASLQRIDKHPDPDCPKTSRLARAVLIYLRLAQAEPAQKALEALKESIKDPKNGTLRVGNLEGDAAIAQLKTRLDELKPEVNTAASTGGEWETYFGNPQRNPVLPRKDEKGVRKWSVPISRLLGNPKGGKERAGESVMDINGQVREIPIIRQNLVTRNGNFFISGPASFGAYSIGNPDPEHPIFRFPSQISAAPRNPNPNDPNQPNFNRGMGLVWHPACVTLGGDYLFAIMGPYPIVYMPGWWGNQQAPNKPNWLGCWGKKKGGKLGVESGYKLWVLNPDEKDSAFFHNSKEDQEWLRKHYFVSAPTYVDGMLYVMAVEDAGANREAWIVALDASNGLIQWKTMICSGTQQYLSGFLQPDLGLPLAVGGGAVFCVTNLGVVASLDAATGGVRWIRAYDRLTETGNNGRGQGMVAATDLWAPNPPMLLDDVLIVTPQDCPTLYALDPQTGERKWFVSRALEKGGPVSSDSSPLTYVLGAVHGRFLVVSSKKGVIFFDAKGGKRLAESAVFEPQSIAGRGLIAGDLVLVPTDKSLWFIDARLIPYGQPAKEGAPRPEKPVGKLLKEEPWENGKVEAGNLFLAGDVLFSVSPTHVNGYFNLAKIETRLKEKLEKNPGDLASYIELGELYHQGDRFEDALAIYDKGLAKATANTDEGSKASAQILKSRKFETFFKSGDRALGDKDAGKEPDYAKALSNFEQALATAVDNEQFVRGLWGLAETSLSKKDPGAAIQYYHRMLMEQGETAYEFEAKTQPSKAGLFAQRRMEKIKKENPGAMDKLEGIARSAYDAANAKHDAADLEKVAKDYPNTQSGADALAALGELYFEQGKIAQAAQICRKFLIANRASPKAAGIIARLAVSSEKDGQLLQARSYIKRLINREEYASATISLPGEGSKKASEWATERLAGPNYSKGASYSPYRVGSGKLTEGWSKPWPGYVQVLHVEGNMPAAMKNQVLFLENNNRIALIDGRTGADVWKERVQVPQGFFFNQQNDQNQIRLTHWCGDNLIVSGLRDILAIDSKTGQTVWKYALTNAENPNEGGQYPTIAAAEGRVFAMLPRGQAVLLDGQNGQVLWTAQTGNQYFGPPAFGDSAIAVALNGGSKIMIYDLETGERRADFNAPSGRVILPPQIAGDRLILASSDNGLYVHDLKDGKELWHEKLDGMPAQIFNDGERVFVGMRNIQVSAFDLEAKADAKHLLWSTIARNTGEYGGMAVDGEDLILIHRVNSDTGRQKAIATTYGTVGGRMNWEDAELASFWWLDDQDLAREAVLLFQQSPQENGQVQTGVALRHRKTGKLVWVKDLGREQPAAAALFDGGVLIQDGRKLTAYMAPDLATGAAAQDLATQAAKDPEAKIKLAQLVNEQGDSAKALTLLVEVLQTPNLPAGVFADAFEKFSRIRDPHLKKNKTEIHFGHLVTAPKMDGTLTGLEGCPELKLDTWPSVYLPGEVDRRIAFDASAWKGASDLACSFRGGYDEKNLYLSVVVNDDVQKNPVSSKDAYDLWLGDSLQVAFDLERDKGRQFSGNDFELGCALDSTGQPMAWKWVERAKFIEKPLETPYKITRDEAGKKTVYQITLPLDYLGLKPAAETKFGFTFLVNDSDGEKVEKGIAPSAGIRDPKDPSRYAVGVLDK